MARNGFSWATFCRGPLQAREEGRRWVAWKKGVAGDAASAGYELIINDVARYLAAQATDPITEALFEKAKVPITDVEYDHPDPYSAREITALQDYSARDPFTTLRRRAMNLLSSYWGGRRAEQSRTDEDDLDLVDLTMDMQTPGKRGKKRRLPLPSLLASPKRALVAYLEEKHHRFPTSKALWVDLDGGRMAPSILGRETSHMSDELGFRVSFNRWRRSWQTTVRRCGVRKEVAKYLLGHKWETDATDHYWEPDVEDIRRELMIHKVPGFIRSRSEKPREVHLPVPFARNLDREIETAA